MQVKLCSVGYSEFDILAQKFFVLYNTCKEQLSAQKHYDWGLRNILAVGADRRSAARGAPGISHTRQQPPTLERLHRPKT